MVGDKGFEKYVALSEKVGELKKSEKIVALLNVS